MRVVTTVSVRPRASPQAPKARPSTAPGESPGNRAPHQTPSPEGAQDGPAQSEVSNDAKISSTSRHGAIEVSLFGSASRGDLRAESDFDFLVQAGSNTSAWFPAGLIQDLESLLGRHVDVVTRQALHPLLKDRILAEAVSL